MLSAENKGQDGKQDKIGGNEQQALMIKQGLRRKLDCRLEGNGMETVLIQSGYYDPDAENKHLRCKEPQKGQQCSADVPPYGVF